MPNSTPSNFFTVFFRAKHLRAATEFFAPLPHSIMLFVLFCSYLSSHLVYEGGEAHQGALDFFLFWRPDFVAKAAL